MRTLILILLLLTGCSNFSHQPEMLPGEELLIASSPYLKEFEIFKQAVKAWDIDVKVEARAMPQNGMYYQIYFSENGCETNAWIAIVPYKECNLLGNNLGAGITINNKFLILDLSAIDEYSRNYSIGKNDFFMVTAAHEIGHIIGLEHSNNISEVMFKFNYVKIKPSSKELRIANKKWNLKNNSHKTIYVLL